MTAPLPPEAPIDNAWRGYIYQGFAWLHEQIDAILAVLAGLGTAAQANVEDFEAAGSVSAHAAVTSGVHGISTFGASLVDDTDAAAARTTLGLGTVATQNANNVSLTGGSATGMTSVSGATVTATDNFVTSKTKGEGIKVDPAAPTYAWVDMIGNITIRNTGPTVPTFAVYRGSIRQHQCNAASTEFFNEFHIPHDYAPGTDLYIHVHWSQIVVDTGGTAGAPGDAKWYFEVTYAKGHQQAAFIAPITTSVVQTASGTQYQHMIAEVQLSAASPSASQLDSDDIEVDGLIMVRTYRDGADVADTLNQQPFVHFIDIHYQSTGVGTKQKSPDFWT